jgi:hypothetical protein
MSLQIGRRTNYSFGLGYRDRLAESWENAQIRPLTGGQTMTKTFIFILVGLYLSQAPPALAATDAEWLAFAEQQCNKQPEPKPVCIESTLKWHRDKGLDITFDADFKRWFPYSPQPSAATDQEWLAFAEQDCKHWPAPCIESTLKLTRDKGFTIIFDADNKRGLAYPPLQPPQPPRQTYFNPPPRDPMPEDFIAEAEKACVPRIEGYARYGFRWSEKKPFNSGGFRNRARTALDVSGWNIAYKSSSGNWDRAYYSVRYYTNFDTCEVLDIHIMEDWEKRQRGVDYQAVDE